MGTVKTDVKYELAVARDAGGKTCLSQTGFLPMMYSREGDGVFTRNSYPGTSPPWGQMKAKSPLPLITTMH